jgi:hypothetical protein
LGKVKRPIKEGDDKNGDKENEGTEKEGKAAKDKEVDKNRKWQNN